MATCKPHYLLFCDGCLLPSGAMHTEARGRWRFVLEDIVTGEKTEASDCEPSDHLDRTSLLAVTRGLEALEQPSRVTLITTSRYVARGLQYGLVEWREHDYCWEHFGSTQPIRNADLWKRVDVALRFHEVQCRWMSQESPLRDEPLSIPASSYTLAIPMDLSIPMGVETSSSSDCESCDEQIEIRTECRASQAESSIDDASIEEGSIDRVPIDRVPIEAMVASPANPGAYAVQEASAADPCPSFAPRRMLMHGAGQPLRWLWDAILAADAFLASCLRCLFLLDPRRDHFRRRNY